MVAFPPNTAVAEIWDRIRALPATDRISLAARIMQSLEHEMQPEGSPPTAAPRKPAGNLADIIGLWSDVNPKPTDEELDRILEDSIYEKHG